MGLFPENGGNKSARSMNRYIDRLIAVFTRDIYGILASSALALVSSVIYIAGMAISIDSHALLPMLIAGPAGGAIAAPQIVCLSDTILRSVRGEHGRWWSTYKRAWKQNVRCSLIPGFLGGALFGLQLFIFAHFTAIDIDIFLLAAMALGVILSTAIATWLVPQLALMELPLTRGILNSILLLVRHPLKSLIAALMQLLYWGFLVFTFPQSLILGLILSFWLPMTAVTVILYDPLEETFHIEEALYKDEEE